MKNFYKLFLLIIFVSALHNIPADGQSPGNCTDVVSTDFSDLKEIVTHKVNKYGSKDLLVVTDIDNTVLTSTVDLGSDIWYSWQHGDLDIKPTKDQIVKCLYNDAIGLLYELGTMELTDRKIPDFISNWQQAGITVFALTSRDPRYRSATERELLKKDINFSGSALRPTDGPIPVYQEKVPGDLSYINGIMMVTGMNKGEMLKYLLQKTGRSFKAIIFIDDSRKNLNNVIESFRSDLNVDLTVFEFTRIADDRKTENGGVLLTAKQANRMDREWKTLQKTINKIFPGRTVSDCVSP